MNGYEEREVRKVETGHYEMRRIVWTGSEDRMDDDDEMDWDWHWLPGNPETPMRYYSAMKG